MSNEVQHDQQRENFITTLLCVYTLHVIFTQEDQLFQQKLVDGFLFPHRLDDQPVQVNVQRTSESTRNADEGGKKKPLEKSDHTTSLKLSSEEHSRCRCEVIPEHGEGRELLQIERKIQTKSRFKQSRDRLCGRGRFTRLDQIRLGFVFTSDTISHTELSSGL